MLRPETSRLLERLSAGVVSLASLAGGVWSLAGGILVHQNVKGMVVFAPFGVIIGVLGLYVVLFRWKRS
jgi:hypothetical protein